MYVKLRAGVNSAHTEKDTSLFFPGTPYAASKAAMNQVTKNWGCEWAPDGIRVNAVAPWYTKTPLTEPVAADSARQVFRPCACLLCTYAYFMM